MKTLERSELKKLTGGSTQCVCPNGTYVNCGNASSSECFNIVYQACGGEPAAGCWFAEQ